MTLIQKEEIHLVIFLIEIIEIKIVMLYTTKIYNNTGLDYKAIFRNSCNYNN
jgi:hypothetical protein